MALEGIRKARLEKLEKLQKAGIDPYPALSSRTHKIAEVLADFDELSKNKIKVTLTGRVLALREHGGSTFADLNDGSAKIQLILKEDVVGKEEYRFFLEVVDVGDFVEAKGTLFETKRGEKTLEVLIYKMLAKSLLPLPEKWHGLQDIEERYRKRYLDLMFTPGLKEKFIIRTKIIQELRHFMNRHDFMEVETPTLQLMAGGAMARPFKTHLHTLDLDLNLRIAPELFLKRLLVAGFERVYEFSRNFRNEGMDRDHNPEFSELEFYAAYQDYNWLMEFTEKMFESVVTQIFGDTCVKYKNHVLNFKGPYPRIKFNDLLKKYSDLDYDETDEKQLAEKAEKLGVEVNKTMTKGNLADEIYKKVALPEIIQPTFVIDHPIEISALAKPIEGNPDHAARFQLLVCGREVINAYSELNDPAVQRERFETQRKIAKKGNEEAHPFDEDYLEALEYGMPPAAGWGLGIDRLVALLTDSHSIREIILFPLMRPK